VPLPEENLRAIAEHEAALATGEKQFNVDFDFCKKNIQF
jgi:hypothetical protein